MEDTVVTYKTANLACKTGFKDVIGKFKGKHYYNYKGELDGDILEELKHRKEETNEFDSIPAPTQSLLSKWLREEYNIHVFVYYIYDEWWYNIRDLKDDECIEDSMESYKEHDEALENGLFEALEIIHNIK
jgi:hypothetical protein